MLLPRSSIGLRIAHRQANRLIGCRNFSEKVIQEHDVILFQQRGSKGAPKFHLSPPLSASKEIKLSYGVTVKGSDIIGKRLLDTVMDSRDSQVRLHEASLATYITNTERMTTPIYPHDANMIVSFLDLNLPVPGEDPEADAAPPIEIFEAGTGMGSLTLHLARAIHGANPPVPLELREALSVAPYATGRSPRQAPADGEPDSDAAAHVLEFDRPELKAACEAYLSSRRAILHTLDINSVSSRQAHKVIRRFRRAQYLLDVTFHVRTIRSYIQSRLSKTNNKPFLSHAILDLPSSQDHADVVIEALRPGGKLVVFFPSITQILDFVVWTQETRQPLFLDRVAELPPTTSSQEGGFRDGGGGRDWDVRLVTPKKDRPDPSAVVDAEADGKGTGSKLVSVCRPRAGSMLLGGGFIAVFRRAPPNTSTPESATAGTQDSEGAEELASTESVLDGTPIEENAGDTAAIKAPASDKGQ